MGKSELSALHVLPRAGGGGETYVDVLSSMPGYRATRVYLGGGRHPGVAAIARGLTSVARQVRDHDLSTCTAKSRERSCFLSPRSVPRS